MEGVVGYDDFALALQGLGDAVGHSLNDGGMGDDTVEVVAMGAGLAPARCHPVGLDEDAHPWFHNILERVGRVQPQRGHYLVQGGVDLLRSVAVGRRYGDRW